MNDILGNLQQALGTWARSASESGWLNADAARIIGEAEIATPGSLFDAAERPLVVALFGGTGVGKSSLLNRLAQSPIARASAQRPTSREITVYVHESVTVARLPDEFPMTQMKTSIHQRAEWRNVMWVDMPDFDSVEVGNRALVEQWLPHVDVVLYVVSPERYRDDEGWQLLLEHGRQHAWLFAMNHWDRGEQSQIDDFRQLLIRAGLTDPVIFRTDSSADSEPASGKDDFASLENSIRELADAQFVTQLEQRGVVQRLEELQQQGESLRMRLGDPSLMSALPELWKRHWRRESETLEASLSWNIPVLSLRYARSGEDLLTRLLPWRTSFNRVLTQTGNDDSTPPADGASLMDASAVTRIESSIERFLQEAVVSGAMPMLIAQRKAGDLMGPMQRELSHQILEALNRSLAMPGTSLQRNAVRLIGWLSAMLPLAALAWIGFRVVHGFIQGGSQPDQYLGTNFAINSGMLLALAWGAPALLKYRLTPSMESAAARGMQSGLEQALEEVDHRVKMQLESIASEQQAMLGRYQALWETNWPSSGDSSLPEQLRRLLLEPSEAVRASTQS